MQATAVQAILLCRSGNNPGLVPSLKTTGGPHQNAFTRSIGPKNVTAGGRYRMM